MKKLFLFLYFTFCIFNFFCNAQKETYNWYFGNHCHVSFVSGVPVSITGSALTSQANQEGCSSISDSAGNVLFYTDGMTVWNTNDSSMSNGSGLLGNYSTSQGALIVPKPGNNYRYYVFSLEAISSSDNRLRYSGIDMTLNGGMGDVDIFQKNIILADSMTEKQIAVRHGNGSDYWLITHKKLSDEFQCFLITASGISTIPVRSHVGLNILFNDAVGCMRASLSGTKIAASYFLGSSAFEVYDFDKNTGVVSNPVLFQDFFQYHSAYSVEFSPGERFFYGSCFNDSALYQFDLQTPSSPGILLGNLSSFAGDLLLAPDKKIYFSLSGSNYLGIINYPDSAGTACNFVEAGFDLSPNSCWLGLPNMIHDLISFISAIPVVESNNDFSISPNPVSDEFTITSGQLTINKIEIFNLPGERVYHQQLLTSDFRLPTSDFPNGLYIIKAYTEKGILQQKLVVNH